MSYEENHTTTQETKRCVDRLDYTPEIGDFKTPEIGDFKTPEIGDFKFKDMFKPITISLSCATRFTSAPKVKKVIYSFPATIVFWGDGTKTVVKCGDNDDFDEEKGVAMAFCEKVLGGKTQAHKFFKSCAEKSEIQY